jgi:hypothetical protein
MSDPDRVKFKIQGELPREQYDAITAALSKLALPKTVEVIAKDVKLPKEEKPLVTIPEHLRGKLGNLTIDEYIDRLTEDGRDKSLVYSSWNKLGRFGIIMVPGEEGKEPVVDRSHTLTDRRKNRREWNITSSEAREAGYFVDLNVLASTLENSSYKDTDVGGVGAGIASMWAGLVIEEVKRLEQAEVQSTNL